MGEIDYINDIPEEPGNQIRYRIVTNRGQVVDFVVQYETLVGGSHGQGHRDIRNMRGETVDKWWLPEHIDFGACLEFARNDLKENWRRYRSRFLEQHT